MLKIILYILVNLLPSIAVAQKADEFAPMKDVDSFRKGIEKMAATTNTIQTSFSQEKYLSLLSNTIASEGKMRFKKPQFLKWAYTKPYSYIIVLNGKDLVVSDEGKVSSFDMSSSQVFVEVNDLIVNSVHGNILQEDRFKIEYLENEGLYLARLFPKEEQMQQYIEEIDVYFDKGDFTVSKIQLHEPGEDYTVITFHDKKLNAPIPDEEFDIQ